jgi:DNA-binding response OmpR family regulator
MKKKITIIEDSNDHSEMISRLLSDHEISLANNIVDFYRIAHNNPDLIILDDHLKVGFGNKLYHTLKENPLTKHIPVILITDRESLRNGTHTNFNDHFIIKPFNPGYLVHKIVNLIDAA